MPRKERAGGDLLFTICVDCCNSGVCLYFTVFFAVHMGWVAGLNPFFSFGGRLHFLAWRVS